MRRNELFCCKCLATQPQYNFYCIYCKSTALLSYAQLEQLEIAHLDCDAFYAEVEKRDNAQLLNKPIIIADSARGVVATCCYLARKFGIHSAMSAAKALRLCPDLVIVKPQMSKYAKISAEICSLLLELTPLVEKASIDEFYLDLKGTQKLHKQPPALKLLEYQRRIATELELPVSIGLSYCKFLAKLASDMQKPRGFCLITQNEAVGLLAKLPLNKIQGVGKKLEQKLLADKLYSIGDLQAASKLDFIAKYKTIGARLYNCAHGIDSSAVEPNKPAKSMSKENSFYPALQDANEIHKQLHELAQQLSSRMKKHKLCGKVISLKIRVEGHRPIGKSYSLNYRTNLAVTIFETAQFLLKSLRLYSDTSLPWGHQPGVSLPGVSLLGVAIQNLSAGIESDEFSMLDSEKLKQANLEKAIDTINHRFKAKFP